MLSLHYSDIQNLNSKKEILEAIPKIKEAILNFYTSFSLEDFFKTPEKGWSPKKNVEHLTKAILPVAIGLSAPKFPLLVFGKNSEKKVNLQETIHFYKSKIGSGSQAGIFEPIEIFITKTEEEKKKIIRDLEKKLNSFETALSKWNEEELLEYNMPHPIIGNITVLEMVFFTLFHLFHHTEKVEARY